MVSPFLERNTKNKGVFALGETKNIIIQLNELEKSGIGLFHNVISIHGLEKVKHTLELYSLGEKYGFSKDQLKEIVLQLCVSEKTDEGEGEVELEGAATSEPVEEPDAILKFANAFLEWEGSSELLLSSLEVCQFFDCVPNKTLRTRFCRYFSENSFPSVRVKDPLRYTRNSLTRYKIPLDVGVFSDMLEISKSVPLDEVDLDYFSSYDFLDGTETDTFLVDAHGSRVNVVLNSSLVSLFHDHCEKISYLKTNDDGAYANTPQNMLLLGRGLEKCFQAKNIQRLCADILGDEHSDSEAVKDVVLYVRNQLEQIKARSLWDSKEIPLATKMQGRIFLLTHMLIMYRAEDLSLLPLL